MITTSSSASVLTNQQIRYRMIERATMFLVIVFMTIGCLRSELISFQQIDSLRKKAILQSYNERFHVSNITFACNQTNNANTMDMLRKVLKKEKVRF